MATSIAIGNDYEHLIYRVSVSGGIGLVVGTTRLQNWKRCYAPIQFWIHDGLIVLPYTHHGKPLLGFWRYPRGNAQRKQIALRYLDPAGVTFSVPPGH